MVAGAVPETMGDAGVLATETRHELVAETVGLLAADTPLRARLVEKGRRRAAEFATPLLEARFAQMLSEALGG